MRVGQKTKRGWLPVGTVALVAVAALAACTHKGNTPAPPATTGASASPTVDALTQDATTKALAAYDGYRNALVAASASANRDYPDLPKYTGDPLLAQERLNLSQLARGGLVTTGRPQWTPHVTSVNVTQHPYTVEITDCFDSSGWHTINKATGKSVDAPGQATRYVVTAEAEQYDDGRWLIHKGSADRSRSC